jgi:hypothetical protein
MTKSPRDVLTAKDTYKIEYASACMDLAVCLTRYHTDPNAITRTLLEQKLRHAVSVATRPAVSDGTMTPATAQDAAFIAIELFAGPKGNIPKENTLATQESDNNDQNNIR